MDIKRIRDRSIQVAKSLGVDILPTLPLMDENLKLRTHEETISRLLAMHAVAAIAHGFPKAAGVAWLNRERLTNALTEGEKQFVSNDIGQPHRFQAQVEGMWALAWVLHVIDILDFAEPCSNTFVRILPDLKRNETSQAFRARTDLRAFEEVASACDLAYCLHWAIRQSELDRQILPAKLLPDVIVERRRALEWLFGQEAWDETSLDT